MPEKAYKNARQAPTDLASGRVLDLGEAVLQSALDLSEGSHDAALVKDGALIETQLPEPELAGAELDARAKALKVEGRSAMTADELRAAVAEAEARGGDDTDGGDGA